MGVPQESDVALAYSMAFDPTLFHKRGEDETLKGGIVKSPNSYVFFAARALDRDASVKRFRHHAVRFSYWNPEKQKEGAGWIDFDVEMNDGSRRMIYVTPQQYLLTAVEEAMLEGAECVARQHKAHLIVWTEVDIFGPNPEYMKSVVRYVMDKIYLQFAKEDDHEAETPCHGNEGDG